jgi:hypothetical protein
MAIDDATVPRAAVRAASVTALDEIVRDIARGGLAALIVGFAVLGIGARVVMRIHALLVPAAAGSATENGNRIGEITIPGTIGLILIVGLLGAVVLGVLWVVLSPWLPGGRLGRGVVAVPVAIALGAHQLIVLGNTDFIVLRHHPLVVATLLSLIAALPLALAFVDAWLDRRLPHGGPSTPAGAVYLSLTILGGLLGAVAVAQAVAQEPTRPLGLVLVALGAVTLARWIRRVSGRPDDAPVLVAAARATIVIGSVVSAIGVWPAIRYALRLG